MRQNGVWGGQLEIMAASDAFRIVLEIHSKLYRQNQSKPNQPLYKSFLIGQEYAATKSSSLPETVHLLHISQVHYRLLLPLNHYPKKKVDAFFDKSKTGMLFRQFLNTKLGLFELETGCEGNCLFQCLAFAIYKNINRHGEIRKRVLEQMVQNKSKYLPFMDETLK